MENIHNLSLKNSFFYVFLICLCLTIIPAFELSASERDDSSDKTGTNASYTSDTIEKMVKEEETSKLLEGTITESSPAKVADRRSNRTADSETPQTKQQKRSSGTSSVNNTTGTNQGTPAKHAGSGKVQSVSAAKSEIRSVSIGKGDVIKVGAPGSNKGAPPVDINAPQNSSPEAIEAVSRKLRKGIEADPGKTIFTHKDTGTVELANPGKTVKKITPEPDLKSRWERKEYQTKTGEVRTKDVYLQGSTDAATTEKLKKNVKDTGRQKLADKINQQAPTKKHVDTDTTPTAKEELVGGKITEQTPTKRFDKKELSGGKVTDLVDTKVSVSTEADGGNITPPKADGGRKNRAAAGDMPQTKQQKISSAVPGSDGNVKTTVSGPDIVPSTGKPKPNVNIPSGKKIKVIGGVGDVLDVAEMAAKGYKNYADTKGDSIDKGHKNLTTGEIGQTIWKTLPGVNEQEASKAFQENRRLESIKRQETITRLENKENLTSDEQAELSKAQIWKEYNQEDVPGTLERRKKQKQLAEKLYNGSITSEEAEKMGQLANEELGQRLIDAKNDVREVFTSGVEGYEANMMERFNAEKEKAQKDGREFREKPDFLNDALPMGWEMTKDAMHAVNPLNQIDTSLEEADIELSTHDERRAWADTKDKLTTKLNSKASEIDKRTAANTTKLTDLLSGQDLTDPEVQDSINALLVEMQQDRERLEELNDIADSKLQEVDPEKLKTLRDLEGALPDVWALAGWSYNQMAEQTEERKIQELEEDLVEQGEDLLDRLRNAEYQGNSDNPSGEMANSTDGDHFTGGDFNVAFPDDLGWQPSAPDIITNERTNSANAANAADQIKNAAQNQAAAYQAGQTANQAQRAESINQIQRERNAQLTDAVIGGVTSGIAEGIGTFGERVGQGASVKISQSITGDKHHSDSDSDSHVDSQVGCEQDADCSAGNTCSQGLCIQKEETVVSIIGSSSGAGTSSSSGLGWNTRWWNNIWR